MKSNRICFRVILLHLAANGHSLLAFQVPYLSWVFPSLYQLHRFVSFLQISNGLPIIINALSHDWAQPGYQRPTLISHTGGGGELGETDGLEYLGFHSCCECSPIRALRDGVDGLSHYKVPKNVRCLLYRFPGPHIRRELSHHWATSPCRLE